MLITKIKQDALEARLLGNTTKARTLTTLLGELETDAKRSLVSEITDSTVIAKLKKNISNTHSTIKIIKDSSDGQDPRIDTLMLEIALYEGYVPSQLSEEELTTIIKNSGLSDIGQIMRLLKTEYSGLYDGKLASTLARKLL